MPAKRAPNSQTCQFLQWLRVDLIYVLPFWLLLTRICFLHPADSLARRERSSPPVGAAVTFRPVSPLYTGVDPSETRAARCRAAPFLQIVAARFIRS